MAEKFTKFMKTTDSQIQEVQWKTKNRKHENTPRCIIIKLLIIRDKEQF